MPNFSNSEKKSRRKNPFRTFLPTNWYDRDKEHLDSPFALEIVLGLASINALRWFLRGDNHYFGKTMMLF